MKKLNWPLLGYIPGVVCKNFYLIYEIILAIAGVMKKQFKEDISGVFQILSLGTKKQKENKNGNPLREPQEHHGTYTGVRQHGGPLDPFQVALIYL